MERVYNWVGLLAFVWRELIIRLVALLFFFEAYLRVLFIGALVIMGRKEYPRTPEVFLLYWKLLYLCLARRSL